MASGEDTGSVGNVKQIPEDILGFVQSQIVHYVGQAKYFSAEIHETGEQTAKLVFNYGEKNEPRREKTGLRGFRPGPTQTGLYKLRKELEA